MSVELLLGLLPFLVVLACPLMMAFSMFGMRNAGCSSASARAPTDASVSLQGLAPVDQIAAHLLYPERRSLLQWHRRQR